MPFVNERIYAEGETMKHNGLIRVVSEQRRFTRIPYLSRAHYTIGPDHSGHAKCHDIGLGGLCLTLRRYVRPGSRVLVTLNELWHTGGPLQFKSIVKWCRSAKDGQYRAGLRVYVDDVETEQALEALARRSLNERLDERGLWSTSIPKVVMG